MCAESSSRLRLGRGMRIKQGRDFARIRQGGRRMPSGCLIGNWRELPEGGQIRLGVITGKKIGNAVVRTRARRLLREAFRLHQHDLERPVELVLVAQRTIVDKGLGGVEQDLLALLRRAKLLKETI